MNSSKFQKNVPLLCPTCGGDDFLFEEDKELVECIGCGLVISKDELAYENTEMIEAEMKKTVEDVLRKEFAGVKGIKIRF